MVENCLLWVFIFLIMLNEKLCCLFEFWIVFVKACLKIIEVFVEKGVLVNVMMVFIIFGLNDYEILEVG